LKVTITKIISFVIILSLTVSPVNSFAKNDGFLKMKSGQPIVVDGDKVEYFEKEGRIVAQGNVSIGYGNINLSCDRIEVDTKSRRALCEGNVRIEQPDGVLTGQKIRYDFAKEQGELISAELEAFPWFGEASQTNKVGKNEYLLKNGYVSTCDHDKVHYRLKAEEIRVFPNDKFIAKNIVFYVKGVPVLWLPYYYHPFVETRAKVQFVPGQSSKWGYFLLSAWRFHIKGDTKVDVLVDYREKKGFAEGVDFYYDTKDLGVPGLGTGLFRTYLIHQNAWGTYTKKAFRDEGTDAQFRRRFQWKHRIDFDENTVGMLEFNKQSDEYVLKDYFYNEYSQANPVPPNYISLITAQENYTFSMVANHRFNDWNTVTQKLPELKLNIPTQQLWDTPFYYTGETSFTMFDKVYAAADDRAKEIVNRLDSFHKINFVTKVGPVNFIPYVSFRETIYNKKRDENRTAGRAVLELGATMFSRFHRTFDVVSDFLNMDINGLRHIVVPSVDYFYTFEPTVNKYKLYQMDTIDSMEESSGILIGLENKLQTKLKNGKSLDLVRFRSGIDFFFPRTRDKYGEEKRGRFRNLHFDLELSPYEWLYIDNEIYVSPKNKAIDLATLDFSIRPWDSLRVDFGFSYEKIRPIARKQLIFDINYRINPKWKVGLYERIDLQKNEIEEQQISLTRDLHCWEAELVYDVDGSNFAKDDYTLWLGFKLKAMPDLQIGLDRSFSRRPPGVERTALE